MTGIKKSKIEREAITRDLNLFSDKTGNLYETIVILSKRADQIAKKMHEELTTKLNDFKSVMDTLEETTENKEQIELVRKYEQMPKPTILAIYEFLNDKIKYKYKNEDKEDK